MSKGIILPLVPSSGLWWNYLIKQIILLQNQCNSSHFCYCHSLAVLSNISKSVWRFITVQLILHCHCKNSLNSKRRILFSPHWDNQDWLLILEWGPSDWNHQSHMWTWWKFRDKFSRIYFKYNSSTWTNVPTSYPYLWKFHNIGQLEPPGSLLQINSESK